MNVPLIDLAAAHAELRAELDAAVRGVVESSRFILGPEVDAFERAFAAYVGAGQGIGVSSGTEALKLTLEALEIGPGDEVIVPTNSFAATAMAVTALGATPRFVDCREDDSLIDAEQALAAVSARTRAIVPVHLYGRLGDVAPLRAANLPIVEDAAQAQGARRQSLTAGNQGIAACFSFYPAKNLGAWGDAGAIVTSDDALATRLRALRNYGQSARYIHDHLGYNARLDALQAAVLSVKLRCLDAWNDRRRAAAAFYDEHLRFGRPPRLPGDVYHLYVVRVANRDELQQRMAEAGIETGIHYPCPLHLQPCFASLGYKPGSLPVAERMSREMLSLPLHPHLTREAQQHVIEVFHRWGKST
ncbi:MAG: DegT/DnrJ/EryC1/StrS family aminotransferase [Pirellulales bacterium]|nr:DegT/DnrJ/EryC1/StrS family aminotransferase [Pirellulales bacterium]